MGHDSRMTIFAVCAALFSGGSTLHAQGANPMTNNLKQSWANVNNLLTRMADKMPEQDYRFKPVPEVQDFGQRMAHVVGFNLRFCSLLKGEQRSPTFSAAPTKAEIVAAMKEVSIECDSMFSALTDGDALTMINTGRAGMRTKLSIIEGPLLEHSQEMYGYMAVYLRLKGIVPPSSDRNER